MTSKERLDAIVSAFTHPKLPRGQHQILKAAVEFDGAFTRDRLVRAIGVQREACGKPASGAASTIIALEKRIRRTAPAWDPPLTLFFDAGSAPPLDTGQPSVLVRLRPEVMLAAGLVRDDQGHTLAEVLAGPWSAINAMGADQSKHPTYQRSA